MTETQMHELLELYGIATNEEITLVSKIIGYSKETMLKILYVRTGCRNFEQFENEN